MRLTKRGRLHVSEAQLQRGCIEFLRFSGYYVRPAPKETYRNGVLRDEPDLMCSKGGRTIWFELKTEKGKLTEGQIAWHRQARSRGEHVYVVRSLDQLRAVLLMEAGVET